MLTKSFALNITACLFKKWFPGASWPLFIRSGEQG